MAYDFTPEEKAAADASRPYEPLGWETKLARPKRGWEAHPDRCCAQVHDEMGVGHHQCTKPVRTRIGRLGYCHIHHPDAVKARGEKRDANTKKYLDGVYRKVAYAEFSAKAIAALREIAAGHNDPRALASSLLEPFDAKYPPKQETYNG